MKARNRKFFLWLLALVMVVAPGAAVAADVDVFAEGAYTATDLVVYIYANINADNLCSYGVKLSYDAGKLNVPNAQKNDAVWYFGTSSAKQPYMNPDTATAGQVIYIGGKLDTGSPTAGVTIGSRILLGKATFTRKNDSTMGLGTTAQDYFGIGLALGKASPYDNFVTTAGVVKDGAAAFGPKIIRERGDANASGSITVRDIATVKELVGTTNFPVYADCNDSDSITVRDIACIKDKLQ